MKNEKKTRLFIEIENLLCDKFLSCLFSKYISRDKFDFLTMRGLLVSVQDN